MRPGAIWGVMLQRKVFQQWEVIDELTRKYSYLPKSYIRMRVQEMVRLQTENGALVKVHDSPVVLAVDKYADRWEELYKTLYSCEVCGKEFIPSMPHQKVCGEECKREHYRRLYREYRRPKEIRDKNKRFLPWTREEEELLIKSFPDLRYSKLKAKELSLKLKRSPEAIRRRLYQLRRGVKA